MSIVALLTKEAGSRWRTPEGLKLLSLRLGSLSKSNNHVNGNPVSSNVDWSKLQTRGQALSTIAPVINGVTPKPFVPKGFKPPPSYSLPRTTYEPKGLNSFIDEYAQQSLNIPKNPSIFDTANHPQLYRGHGIGHQPFSTSGAYEDMKGVHSTPDRSLAESFSSKANKYRSTGTTLDRTVSMYKANPEDRFYGNFGLERKGAGNITRKDITPEGWEDYSANLRRKGNNYPEVDALHEVEATPSKNPYTGMGLSWNNSSYTIPVESSGHGKFQKVLNSLRERLPVPKPVVQPMPIRTVPQSIPVPSDPPAPYKYYPGGPPPPLSVFPQPSRI